MSPFEILPGLYHLRLFQIRAPFTAGLYHFKVYVDEESIGEGNFPIIIVKSDINPAYVSGLVALRGLTSATLVSGRVTATGVTSLGRYAEAIAYFGPGDLEREDDLATYYRYWMFGVPAGTFELTASASGFLKGSSRMTVAPGQSLTLADLELEKGVEIHVTVWSKGENGPIPWGNLWQLPYGTNDPYLPIDDEGPHRDILIRLLNEHNESLAYWASDDIDPPYGPPWNANTIDGKRACSRLILKPSTLPSSSSYDATLTDIRGLPSVRLDGHVPADKADLIEGIGAGSYRLEIQVTGYVTYETDNWQRSIVVQANTETHMLEADMRRSSWINAIATISNRLPPPVTNSTIVVVAKNTDGFEKGIAAGRFLSGTRRFSMVLEGFNGEYNYLRNSTNYQDYGLAMVDYTLEVYMADMGNPWIGIGGTGWYLMEEGSVDVHLNRGAVPFMVSFHLEPSSIEFVLRSLQIQQPPQAVPWTFPGAGISVDLTDELGNVAGTLDPLFYGLVQDEGTIINDPYDMDTTDIGWHAVLGVLFAGVDRGPIRALAGDYPTRIVEGNYSLSVSTLGYIQRRDCSVYVHRGVQTGVQVDLVQGAHIRVELEFRHENVAAAFNGFVRVEVYNEVGTLVGASIYAGADANPNLAYLPYDPTRDWKLVPGAAEGAGTEISPQRAIFSQLHYGIPPDTWANWPAMTRSDANRLSMPRDGTVAFDVFGFHFYRGGSDSRRHGLWANGWDTTDGADQTDSGMRGSKDVLDLEGWGNFTVRVWAFDPYGPDGKFDSNGPDEIFGTEDDYTSSDLVEGGLSDFRAYTQADEIADLEAPWGGTVAVRVTLDELPSLLGTVSWVDMHEDQRGLAWAQVMDTSPGGAWASTTSGSYRLWLPNGSHELLVTTIGQEQLWEPLYFEITLPISGSHTFRDIVLTATEKEVPEFTSSTWLMVIILTSLPMILSRRRSGRSWPCGGRQMRLFGAPHGVWPSSDAHLPTN
jgi:hypothetical protein